MKSSPKTSPAFRFLKIATHRGLLSVPWRSCSVPARFLPVPARFRTARPLGGARPGPAEVPPWTGCAPRPRFTWLARASAGARDRARKIARNALIEHGPLQKVDGCRVPFYRAGAIRQHANACLQSAASCAFAGGARTRVRELLKITSAASSTRRSAGT